LSDQLNEETPYDLNTPQMHANLHSEFLQSVSKTNQSRSRPVSRTVALKSASKELINTPIRKVVTSKCDNKTPMKPVDPKRSNVTTEPKRNVEAKRKTGVNIPPRNDQAYKPNSSTRNLQVSKHHISSTAGLGLTIKRKVGTKTRKSDIPFQPNSSSSNASLSKKIASGLIEKDKLDTKAKPDNKSLRSKESSNLYSPNTRRSQKLVKRNTNQPKVKIDSKQFEGKSQVEVVTNNSSNIRQPKSTSNRVRKDYNKKEENHKLPHPNIDKDLRSRSMPTNTKSNSSLNKDTRRTRIQNTDEKLPGIMDTIEEEELKEVAMVNKDTNQLSKSQSKEVDPSGTILPTESESFKRKLREAKRLAQDAISPRYSAKRKELQQLEEIEKEFVAFLLPWLKLVPTASTSVNNIRKEKQNTHANRGLNNYLNSLSKVYNLNNFPFVGGEMKHNFIYLFSFLFKLSLIYFLI